MSARLHTSKGFCIACLSRWRLSKTLATREAIAATSGTGVCSGACVSGARSRTAMEFSFLDASYLSLPCQGIMGYVCGY